jgi:hypothetical protein
MKITTHAEYEWNGREYVLTAADREDYDGPLAAAKGGGGSTTTVEKADPWSGQQPHLLAVFERAKQLADTPLAFFPGQTYAGLAPETETALRLQAQRAMAGSPLTAAAQGQLASTLRGDYLGAGNPYFGAMFNRIANQVAPRVDAQFAAGGRYGSGARANALASALADTAGQLAYQDYAAERQNQMSGLSLAPPLAQQDYFDLARLAEAGGVREDLAQQAIDEAQARHDFAQREPWERLALYNRMIQGQYGGTRTTTQSLPRRPLGQGILGGAAQGASLGGMFGPWGAAAGGILGGILGGID